MNVPDPFVAPAKQTVRESLTGRAAFIVLCAILIGAAIRLAIYLQNPSFWFDEADLALSVATSSRFDLQTAAPLYLFMERMFALAGGMSEISLRLPSLLCGLLLPVLVAALGFRIGGSWAGALSAAIAAVSANLSQFSNELKPYAVDAAVSAALLLLAMPMLNGDTSRLRRALLFAFGIVAVMLSTPAIFVLISITLALFLRESQKGSHRSRLLYPASALLVWLVSFLIVYKLFYEPVARSEFMHRFWAGAVVTPSSGLLRYLAALSNSLVTPLLGLDDDLSAAVAITGALLLVTGVWAVWRRSGRSVGTVLCLPPCCAFGAALIGKWHLTVRLMLFCVPQICVLMAMGASQISRFAPRAFQLRTLLLISALTLAAPAKYTLWRIRHPEIESNRSMVAAAVAHALPGDVVYVYPRSTIAWLFYSVDWRRANLDEARRIMAAIARSGPNAGNVPPRGRPVIGEGYDWRFERAGRIELFGVPTGIDSTMSGISRTLDAGWADNEVDRMLRERSARRFWIVLAEYQAQAVDSLLDCLAARGFSVQPVYSGVRTVLYLAARP